MRDRLIPVSDREARLDEARTAYGRNDWTVARSRLLDADADQPIGADDLERLAWSCRWVGDEVGFLNALERAEVAFTEAGARAVPPAWPWSRPATTRMMLDGAVALTCYVRATELLAERRSAPSTRRRGGRWPSR